MKSDGRIRSMLLCVLGSFSVGVLLCQIKDISLWGAAVFLIAGILGSTAGALATGSKSKGILVLLGIGLLSSAAVAVWRFGGFLMPIFSCVIYMLTLGALIVSGYGFYGPLGVWSTILSALSAIAATGVLSLLTLCITIGCLILTTDGFRDSSLRKSQHKKREYKTVDNPGHMVQHSYILLGLFLAVALLFGVVTLGLSSGLVNGAKRAMEEGTGGIGAVLNWIFWLIEAAIQWFSDLFPDLEPGRGTPAESGERDIPIYQGGDGSRILTLIMVIVFVCACLLLSIMAGRLLLKSRKNAKNTDGVCDFEDEIEELERPRFGLRWRLGKKKQHYRDIQDPALKIRYVFQQLLRRKSKNDGTAIVKTPNELLDTTVPDEETLICAYNRVKYACGNVSGTELEAAERYLRHL